MQKSSAVKQVLFDIIFILCSVLVRCFLGASSVLVRLEANK